MMIIAMALAIAALMVTGGPPNVAQILVVPMLMVAVRRGLVDREPPREDGIGFAGVAGEFRMTITVTRI
jgi:hypothetical protein